MKKIKTTIGVILFLLVVQLKTSTAQSAKRFAKDLDRFIQDINKTFPEIPGMSVVVVRGDQTIFLKGYGYADVAQKIKFSPDETVFYIASTTKSFTGMLAGLLHHQGKVDLNATLAKSFPHIPFHPETEASQVKLQDLITHTSGLGNLPFGVRRAYTGLIDNPQVMDWVLASQTRRRNRRIFRYTNLGYHIYSYFTDKKLGTPWQDLLQETLFKPLQMNHTTAYMSLATKNNWVLAKPYYNIGSKKHEELYLTKKDNTMHSAGGLITTAKDMANWLIFNINQGKFKGKQVIPQEVVKMAHSALVPDDGRGGYESLAYGLGWFHGKFQGKKVLYHDGGFPGFRTHVSFMPGQKIGLTVMVNDAKMGNNVKFEISKYVYDWWLSKGKVDKKKYLEKLSKLREKYDRIKAKVRVRETEFAQRKSTLTEPLSNYTGVYYNKAYGKLSIVEKDGKLEVSHGNLHALAIPHTKPNSLRAELTPKSGWIVTFKVRPGKKVKELDMDGDLFKRVR